MRESADRGSGGEAQHVLRGVAADLRIADLHAGGNPQVPEALGDLRILDHAAADERDLAIELRREVDQNLHTIDARRERRDDDAAGGAREDLLERLDHLELRAGEAAAIDVGAVGEERQHAFRSELREAVHVEVLAVDRRLIDLEIARVHDDAGRSANRQGDAVRHRMRHADELDVEGADRDAVARAHRPQAAGGLEAVLLELRLDERERQRRPEDRSADERQHVRNGADVIFVPVRQHERGRAAFLLEVRHVRNDPVHAEELGIGEHHSRIDDDRRLAPGEGEHVHAEFTESAEGNDF
jgi:hypothetical protein